MKLLLATVEESDCPLLVSNTKGNMHIQIQEIIMQYSLFICKSGDEFTIVGCVPRYISVVCSLLIRHHRMLIISMKCFISHAMVTDQNVRQ